MSSDADKYVFEKALEEQDNTPLFQAKRYTYVTDSSSNNGNFNGQIQFDLNTLSSQNQWTNLSEAIINFPVKITASVAEAEALGGVTAFAATIKNGFHQFIDSVQVVINGTTVQSSQIFENVNTSFKLLTECSQDELKKWGPTIGFAIDDYKVKTDGTALTSLDNVALATIVNPLCGVSYPANNNSGYKARAEMLNSNSGTTLMTSILTNPNLSAKGSVQIDASGTTANTERFVAFMMGTVRFKDISDFAQKCPCLKNLKGYIYLNYNSAKSVYTATAATGVVKTSITNTPIYGRCQPAMINKIDMEGAADKTITFTCEISGTAGTNLTTAKPPITNARLIVPYYIASPEVDRTLAQKKSFRFNERFVTVVDIAKTASTNVTITPGVSNPKRIIMLPVLYGTGASGGTVADMAPQPELSPFDIAVAGGGSSPFASLRNLQVLVGNQPMFQNPVDFDFDVYNQEIGTTGLDGGLNIEQSSGLLSQTTWNQNHKYYTVDIGRRVGGDDGASKSVQLSCYNPCNAPMKLICMVWYEREVTVDTALGVAVQNM
jgi:hypothetical protein